MRRLWPIGDCSANNKQTWSRNTQGIQYAITSYHHSQSLSVTMAAAVTPTSRLLVHPNTKTLRNRPTRPGSQALCSTWGTMEPRGGESVEVQSIPTRGLGRNAVQFKPYSCPYYPTHKPRFSGQDCAVIEPYPVAETSFVFRHSWRLQLVQLHMVVLFLEPNLYGWLVCPMCHFSRSQKMLHMPGDFWSRSTLKRRSSPDNVPRWQANLLDAVFWQTVAEAVGSVLIEGQVGPGL